MLSTRLIAELGDMNSTLRAAIQRNGPVVVVLAGGEIDAANEHTWRQLVSEAAAVATPPGRASSTSTALISWPAARLRS